MGLFDKIKDNAKAISIKAIEEGDDSMSFIQPNQTAQISDDNFVADDTTTTTEEPATKSEETNTKQDAKDSSPKTAEEVKDEPEAQTVQVKSEKTETTEEKKTEKPVEEKTEPKKSKITESPKPSQQKDPLPSYTPYYKQDMRRKADEANGKKSDSPVKSTRVNDVTPHQPADPAKRAIFARERAAMTALAAQRRMNGSVALYVTNYLKFKTRVYINRIEYSGSFGKNILPIEDVAWIKLRYGGTGVIIETTQGKRVVMVIKPAERLAFTEAVMKVQSLQPKRAKFIDTQTVRLDQLEELGEGIDEIEKLAKMFEKGILTQEEFEAKKKQILGI